MSGIATAVPTFEPLSKNADTLQRSRSGNQRAVTPLLPGRVAASRGPGFADAQQHAQADQRRHAACGGRQREHYEPILRPGCYVAHDHRLYHEAMADVKTRQPDLEGELQPALAVFAHVQSLPEPGLAIVAMGKRDISCDPDLPMPLRHYRPGEDAQSVADWRVTDVMDQHTFMKIPENAVIEVGDIISFGASHSCLTFDKWRRVLRVNADLDVLEIMPTCF